MSTLWIIILIVIVIVAVSLMLSIASFSFDRFYQRYTEFSSKPVHSDMNILDFVHNLNFVKFHGSLKLAEIKGDVSNFYSPKTKTVALSRATLSSNSIASFAIVAHEMGHAMQDMEGSKLTMFNILRRIGSLLGFLFMPALLAGIILLFFGESMFALAITLLCVSAGIFVLAVLLKAVLISIEKDASNNGIEFLSEVLTEEDVNNCKKLLNSARLTYWGDLFRLLFSWTLLTPKTKMFNM